MENGLGSPLCRNPGELSAAQQRSCQTADFVAAPDPTNDYAFDVNINTGIDKWGNDIATTVENFAQSGWMVLVSATHGLVVVFEWCYSLNLLDGSVLREVTVALHNARLTFTEPWMAIALAVASMLAVYHGLIRRRVTDTIGGVVAMLAMMAGGLWVIADPAGTIGAVEQWANQAGLGTLAVIASGSPKHPERTLAESMQVLFSSVVGAPWCYMEFGDVDWCQNSGQLDGRLRKAGLAIADNEDKKSGCHDLCDAGASPANRTLAASAMLLREARTNGELFLALPANEPERNSVKDKDTLLDVLCGGGESADKCRGPTAPQAEFRSEKAALSRMLGLALIWIGTIGMLMLLGFLALRLLYAALMGLFFLFLAPAAVLAPALGDGGRLAFRRWALKLMEAVVAKVTYSFLLGVVLMMMKILLGLTILGWLTQWLLISAFWWGVFIKRDQVLGFAPSGGPGRLPGGPRSLARRVNQALETPLALLRVGRTVKEGFARPAPEVRPSSTYSSSSDATVLVPQAREVPDGEKGDRGRDGGGDTDLPAAHHGYALVDQFGGSRAERSGGESSRRIGLEGEPELNGLGSRNESYGAGSDGTSGARSGNGQMREGAGMGEGRSRMRSSDGGRKGGHELGGDRRHQRVDAGTATEAMHAGGSLAQARTLGQNGTLGRGGALGQSGQLERVRHERQKALAEGNTQRAAKLGAREQRVEAELTHQGLALERVDPELAVGELMADAIAARHIDGNEARGDNRSSDDSIGPVGADLLEAAKGRSNRGRSRVMDDAREVAARRKRQLGWGVEH